MMFLCSPSKGSLFASRFRQRLSSMVESRTALLSHKRISIFFCITDALHHFYYYQRCRISRLSFIRLRVYYHHTEPCVSTSPSPISSPYKQPHSQKVYKPGLDCCRCYNRLSHRRVNCGLVDILVIGAASQPPKDPLHRRFTTTSVAHDGIETVMILQKRGSTEHQRLAAVKRANESKIDRGDATWYDIAFRCIIIRIADQVDTNIY